MLYVYNRSKSSCGSYGSAINYSLVAVTQVTVAISRNSIVYSVIIFLVGDCLHGVSLNILCGRERLQLGTKKELFIFKFMDSSFFLFLGIYRIVMYFCREFGLFT